MLPIGSKAPVFTAPSTVGEIRLADYLGSHFIVLIFYPRDNTPVCTKQLCAVQESYDQFIQLDTVVLGINSASVDTHLSFSAKHGYTFPLIYDQNEQIRKLYDVKKMFGIIAQQRTVYMIDKNGNISFAKMGNPPPDQLLALIKQLSGK